jgi:hypothetical protein
MNERRHLAYCVEKLNKVNIWTENLTSSTAQQWESTALSEGTSKFVA